MHLAAPFQSHCGTPCKPCPPSQRCAHAKVQLHLHLGLPHAGSWRRLQARAGIHACCKDSAVLPSIPAAAWCSHSVSHSLLVQDGLQYVKCAQEAGLDVDVRVTCTAVATNMLTSCVLPSSQAIAPRLSFFFAIGMNFYMEVPSAYCLPAPPLSCLVLPAIAPSPFPDCQTARRSNPVGAPHARSSAGQEPKELATAHALPNIWVSRAAHHQQQATKPLPQ